MPGTATFLRDAIGQMPRLDDEDVARETIQNSFRRIADQQSLKSAAGYRAHDHQRAVNFTGYFGDGIRRMASDDMRNHVSYFCIA